MEVQTLELIDQLKPVIGVYEQHVIHTTRCCMVNHTACSCYHNLHEYDYTVNKFRTRGIPVLNHATEGQTDVRHAGLIVPSASITVA